MRRDALEKSQALLEEKDRELAAVRDRIVDKEESDDRVAELEQERLLLAIDVGNLRNQLTRAEADNHFVSGTIRQLHQIMARKNLSMHSLGISNEHIKEVFRICNRIEETRRKRVSETSASPSSAIATAQSDDEDDHFLPGTPRGIFLSPRSRARMRRSGGFRG